MLVDRSTGRIKLCIFLRFVAQHTDLVLDEHDGLA